MVDESYSILLRFLDILGSESDLSREFATSSSTILLSLLNYDRVGAIRQKFVHGFLTLLPFLLVVTVIEFGAGARWQFDSFKGVINFLHLFAYLR